MLDREYDMISHSFMVNRLKLSGKVGDRDMSETISEQVGVVNCLLCYNQLYRRFWTNVVAIKVFGGLRLWYTCASYFVFVSPVRTLYLYLARGKGGFCRQRDILISIDLHSSRCQRLEARIACSLRDVGRE